MISLGFAHPGLRGAEAPMMPRSDFSGLLSSACALASAAAIGDRFIPPGGEATKQLWGVKTVSTVSTAAARIRLIPGGGLPLGLVSPQSMPLPTLLTVLTVVRVGFARDALSLMIRVPARPSRPKLISIPSARSGVCARRSRPARARGDFGHPTPVRDASSLEG
jgi:hypothetical protein